MLKIIKMKTDTHARTTLYRPMHHRSNRICPEKPFTNANQSWRKERWKCVKNTEVKINNTTKRDVKPISKILSHNIKLKAEVNSYKQKPAHTRSYTCTLAVHPPQCLRYEDKDSLWTLTFKALLCWKLIPQRDPKCPSPPNTDRCAWTIAFHKYRDI